MTKHNNCLFSYYMIFSQTTRVYECSFQPKGLCFMVLLSKKWAIWEHSDYSLLSLYWDGAGHYNPPPLNLNSNTFLHVFMNPACLFSPAVGLFMGQCVGVYIVLWEVITHGDPQGEPDSSSNTHTHTAGHQSWRRAPPSGSWETFEQSGKSHVQHLLFTSFCRETLYMWKEPLHFLNVSWIVIQLRLKRNKKGAKVFSNRRNIKVCHIM